ncbi:MAG: asparagine synthase (glutamine-hydrolyzing) [Glaciecola sp.]|jgi:asparagine synthase (glutamine-hydrolysing)
MCGISGFISLSGINNIDESLLKTMNRTQAHRGPDAEGYYFDQGIGLAHRRLSIIDVSSGQQPMFSDDKNIVIVFNGEIYNFLDINAVLQQKGYVFKTHSDTETIIHAYQEWGTDCLQHFNGMFAFVLYDKAKQSVFIVRDRIGEKPFFYTVINNNFLFSSELKVLQAHPEFDQTLSPQAVEDYLTFGYVPETRSIFKRVSKLQPAHFMQFHIAETTSATVLRQHKYWDIADTSSSKTGNAETLYTDFKQKVSQRMMSEVPLGAFLSGGVDSSGVVAAMAQLNPDKKVTSCSIGFDVPEFNESEFAQAVADKYNTDHHLDIVSHNDFGLIDQLIDMYDEPFADSSALPTFKVCEVARKYVTVCLSGDAGDELFAGYRRYKLHKNEEKVRSKIPSIIRELIFKPLSIIYPKADWAPRFLRAKTTFQSLAMSSWKGYLNSVSKIREDERKKLYSRDFHQKLEGYNSEQVFVDALQTKSFNCPVKEAQYLDFKTWMPSDILVKVDRASMANSLEVRVPMLDHEFIDSYFSLQTEQNVEGSNGKALFKKALEPHLPHDNLYREKMGFSIPLAEWLRGPLKDKLLNAINEPKLLALDIFDSKQLNTMFQAHIKNKRDYSAELWTVFMFSQFVQKNKVHW